MLFCLSILFSLFALFLKNGNIKIQNLITFYLHNICTFTCSYSKIKHKALCRLIVKPIENNDPMPYPRFDFPVFEAEEESVEEIPDEISRLLEHEEKVIQPHEESIEIVNLGFEDDKKEVKIGALLGPDVKKRMVELLREFVDVFA